MCEDSVSEHQSEQQSKTASKGSNKDHAAANAAIPSTEDIPNYRKSICSHRELRQMKELLLSRIMDASNRAIKRKTQFLEYSYLWTDSRTEFMHYFLTYGRQLTQEEIESLEEDDKAIKKQYPSLDQFKEQIDTYEGLYSRQ